MPKVKISEYSATANSNTDVASINIDEGCAPSGINNAIRAVMGHLKDFQSGTSNDPFTVGSSGSLTLSYGTANGVAYLNGSKVVTTGSALTFDGTNLGIGLASPGCKVDVLAASNTSLSPTVRVYSNNLAVNTAISYDGIQGSGDFYIGSTSNSPVIFKQSNTEQMRLTSTGLGIGNTSPASYNSAADNLVIGTSGSNGMTIVSGSTSSGYIMFADGTTGQQAYEGQITYDHTNNFMAFNTSGTERARINSSGYFKASNAGSYLGSTSAYHELDSDADNSTVVVRNTNSTFTSDIVQARPTRNTTNGSFKTFSYYNEGAGAFRFQVLDSGNVQNTNNSYGAISDAKLKENIVDTSPKLNDLMQVRVRNFNFKDDQTHKQIGVIAQELEQVFPALVEEFVDRDAEGNDLGTTTKSVKYSVFVPMLIKALQEQQSIIQSLTARITALEGA